MDMRMTDQDRLTLKKLDQLYEKHNRSIPLVVNANCCECGVGVRVEIHKTLSGYGLNNGFVFATGDGQLMARCSLCHQSEKILMIQNKFAQNFK
jgi:hypothetical protein